jgi:hypothetical protein
MHRVSYAKWCDLAGAEHDDRLAAVSATLLFVAQVDGSKAVQCRRRGILPDPLSDPLERQPALSAPSCSSSVSRPAAGLRPRPAPTPESLTARSSLPVSSSVRAHADLGSTRPHRRRPHHKLSALTCARRCPFWPPTAGRPHAAPCICLKRAGEAPAAGAVRGSHWPGGRPADKKVAGSGSQHANPNRLVGLRDVVLRRNPADGAMSTINDPQVARLRRRQLWRTCSKPEAQRTIEPRC